jgi:hypothetical protein
VAMGKKRWRQQPMWIANQGLPRSRGHLVDMKRTLLGILLIVAIAIVTLRTYLVFSEQSTTVVIRGFDPDAAPSPGPPPDGK